METPIDKMVLQPDQLRISNEQNGQRMTEVWKGPWSEIRKLTSLKDDSVFSVKIIPGQKRPSGLDSTPWTKEFSTPQASTGEMNVDWIVDSVDARQIQAGDLGVLTINYSSVRDNSSGGGGGSIEPDAPANAELTRPTSWSVSWGTFTRSPLEYAQNSTGGRPADILDCLKNDHPGSLAEAQAQIPDVDPTDFKYCYYRGTSDIYRRIERLVDNQSPESTKIYDYMTMGITPQFHYPIVSKEVYFKIPAGVDLQIANVGLNIDKKQSLPDDCPYGFEEPWEWLKTDDRYQVDVSRFDGTEYTRTLTWTGAYKWDDNFYGPSAWTPADWGN